MKIPLAVIASLTALLVFVPTASAHGGEGEVQLTKAEQTGPTSVLIQAGVLYISDGHLAETATVSATLTGPSDQTLGPIPLSSMRSADTQSVGTENSLYEANIDLPAAGEWSVALSSQNPSAEASGEFFLVEGFDSAKNSADPVVPASGASAGTDQEDSGSPSLSPSDMLRSEGGNNINSTLGEQDSTKPAGKSRLPLYLGIGIVIGVVLACVVANKKLKDNKASGAEPTE